MAIDTVKLRSPFINEKIASYIEKKCCYLRQGIDLTSGEPLYSITTGNLRGTWDNQISIRVNREDFVTLNGRQVLKPSKPYLLIEGSVHKLLLGHNVYGGPKNVQSSLKQFILTIQNILNINLPAYSEWYVRRIDWAEVYILPPQAIKSYFLGLRNCTFPRRKVHVYGLESLYAPGTTTTIKLYHKGPEFRKHDRKRLKQIIPNDIDTLFKKAEERLRVEVEIHAKKLDSDFKKKPRVKDLSENYLMGIHDKEINKLLREGSSEMKIIRDNESVKSRLDRTYKASTSRRLFGIWLQLSTLGEDTVKDAMPKTSFYRDRKALSEIGISWNNTDITIKDDCNDLLPRDFSPIRTDARFCNIKLSDVEIKAVSTHG